MAPRTLLIIVFILGAVHIDMAQTSTLDYLKSTSNPGDPSASEILQWVEKNLIFGSCIPDINSVIRRTCDPNGEDYSPTFAFKMDSTSDVNIPCDVLPPYFVINEIENTFNFKVDNMGCFAGTHPIEPGKTTVFLDNFDPDSIKISDGNITIMSWTLNSSKQVLGYVVWNNYNNCAGTRFKTFTSLTFPLPKLLIKDIQFQNKLITALRYLGKISSAKNNKCVTFER